MPTVAVPVFTVQPAKDDVVMMTVHEPPAATVPFTAQVPPLTLPCPVVAMLLSVMAGLVPGFVSVMVTEPVLHEAQLPSTLVNVGLA